MALIFRVLIKFRWIDQIGKLIGSNKCQNISSFFRDWSIIVCTRLTWKNTSILSSLLRNIDENFFATLKFLIRLYFHYVETERANYLKFLKNHIIGKLNLDRFWLNPVIYRKKIRRKHIFLLVKLIIWTYLYPYENFKVSILFDIAWSYRQTGVSLLWWGCFTFQLE